MTSQGLRSLFNPQQLQAPAGTACYCRYLSLIWVLHSCPVLVLPSNACGLCLLCFEPTQRSWNEALKASDRPCLHYLLPHSPISPFSHCSAFPFLSPSPFPVLHSQEMAFGPRRACSLSPFLIFHQAWLSLGSWMPSFAAKQAFRAAARPCWCLLLWIPGRFFPFSSFPIVFESKHPALCRALMAINSELVNEVLMPSFAVCSCAAAEHFQRIHPLTTILHTSLGLCKWGFLLPACKDL